MRMALAAASLLLRCRVAWAFSVHHLKARQLPTRPWGVYSSAQRLFAASGDESTREVAPLAVGEMGVKLAGLKRTLTEQQPEQQQEQQQEQPREWDRQGLRKECERLVMRQMKKVGKAEQRLAKAQAGDGTFGTFDEDDLAIELSATEERLAALRQIEADVAALGKKGKMGPELEARLVEYEVGDAPPARPPKGPKKKKGPGPKQTQPRKPYRVFKSKDGVAIYVGKSARDNDELSIDRTIRDQKDWWMHVAGDPPYM
mmetsp:Transcript_23513/g.53033  ORF Transcript_23513/g.53033 Transcript_23513/m.53033 type:complete len:258 (+) Transcript_23513:84-857(+)